MALSRLRGGWSIVQDALRTQLWPLPSIGVGLAVALGVGLPRLDAAVDDDLPSSVTVWLFGGGASAARTVLDAIASSLITVTSLTFSLTVVTLQLASSQFSPRLLRTFTRDRFVHVTLALFLATFTYALTVLRTVRTSVGDQELFVPQVSVTFAFVLALTSVVGLVLFLAHLAQEIRVETMLRNVHKDATEAVHRVLPERDPQAPDRDQPPTRPATAAVVLAGDSGFFVRVDESELLEAAVDCDAYVVFDRHPGSALVEGTPVGVAWPRSGGVFDLDDQKRLLRRLSSAIFTGFERTAAQDAGYGLRQITDVAVKALSPGINDPTTAVHALGHSSALLCDIAGRDLGPRMLRDDEDRVRVVLSRPDLGDFIELAVAQPRIYGKADPFVLARIASLLHELSWCVRPEQRPDIASQLQRLRATARAQDFDDLERERLAELTDRVEQGLGGRWVPEGQGA